MLRTDCEQHAPPLVRKKTSRDRKPDVTSLQNGLFFFSHVLAVIALLETCFTTVDLLFENPPFTVGDAKTDKLLSGIRQGLRERYTTI